MPDRLATIHPLQAAAPPLVPETPRDVTDLEWRPVGDLDRWRNSPGTPLWEAAERIAAGHDLTRQQRYALADLLRSIGGDVDTARPPVLLPHEEAALTAARMVLA